MSKDGEFRAQLKRIFSEIFENKFLVIATPTGRDDYLKYKYSLPSFEAFSNMRGIKLQFKPSATGDNLSERWEQIREHQYNVFNNNQLIATVRRLPHKEFIFVAKPYDAHEVFADKSLRGALELFENVTIESRPEKL